MPNIDNIGKNLKEAIKNSNYSQKDIADILKINKDTITNYTRENSIPRLDILIKICELIKIPINEIIYGIDANNINEMLISKFNKLTDEQKERIIEQIEFYENKNSKMSSKSEDTGDVKNERSNTG